MINLFKNTIILSSFLLIAACSKSGNSHQLPTKIVSDSFRIYPVPEAPLSTSTSGYAGWVGDVMPYFFNDKFQIFFLHDAIDKVKQSSQGQHPIHRFTSSNLLDFNYEGEAIPYGNINTQDHLIGTGSIIKADNTYYFYYTGHNGNSNWLQDNNPGWFSSNNREAIMYATSKDLTTWAKKEAFVLKSPKGFSRSDFRDPFVFYNEEFREYWMLISSQQSGKGTLVVYKTGNPASDNWELRGTLDVEGDYPMLECADVFKWGQQYYMLFAEDWSDSPGTHYRIANSTAGPWKKPLDDNDMFDGHQFYAGRMASNGSGYYTFGWAHRRNPENNYGSRTWAGNLISHELVKLNNGKLGVKSPEAVKNYFQNAKELNLKGQAGSTSQSGSTYTLDASDKTAGVAFNNIQGPAKITGEISFSNTTGVTSIGFNSGAGTKSAYEIKFEPSANRIAAYNNGAEVTRVPFKIESGKTYSFTLILDNSIAVLYCNNEVALTNRIYGLNNTSCNIQANKVRVLIKDLKYFTH